MTAQRKDEKVCEMYAAYQKGKTLAEVAGMYGVSRQSVYEVFKNRGLPMRSKPFQPTIEFDGNFYTINKNGYYRKTKGNRSLLHRDVWEFHNQMTIPDGCDVHHIDLNKTNNDISNLECVDKITHGKIHTQLVEVPTHHCLQCGEPLVRRLWRSIYETPSQLTKRKFCNTQCKGEWFKEKPRGVKA